MEKREDLVETRVVEKRGLLETGVVGQFPTPAQQTIHFRLKPGSLAESIFKSATDE